MSVAIQFRRGTTANHSSFAGLLGEVTVDTTKKTLVVHDGSTLGGTPLAKEAHTHTAGSISGLTYQTIQVATTPQTQQTNLNFSNLFSASNDTPNSRTTITLANNNTTGAGTYGTTTKVPQIVLSATGLITSVNEVTIAGVAPGGAAGGDLKNSYPNPGVASVGGASATDIANATTLANAATDVNTPLAIVKRDASGNFTANVVTAALVGNVTGNCSGSAGSFTGNLTGDITSVGMATTMATVNSSVGIFPANADKNKNTIQIQVDGKGRITSVSSNAITGFIPTSQTAGGDLSGTLTAPMVAMVNGVTAANVASGASAANNATAAATASKIALRDGAGSAAFTNVFHTIKVVTPSATPTFDLTQGAIQQMTISEAITSMTLNGLTAGQVVVFDFVHDNTATNYAIAWPANVFRGGTNVGTSNNKHNSQVFWCDGTNLYALSTMQTDMGA